MKLELKLSNIEFKNFRLFDHIKLHFDEKLTVLISENGAGKTALLEGIASALNVFMERVKSPFKKSIDFKHIYKNNDIQINKKQLVSNIKLTSTLFDDKTTLPKLRKILDEKSANLEEARQNEDAAQEKHLIEFLNYLQKRIQGLSQGKYLDWDNSSTNGTNTIVKELSWKIFKTIAETRLQTEDEIGEQGMISDNLPILLYYSTERVSINTKDNLEKETDTEKINAYDDALNGKALNFKWFLEWFIWKEDNIKTDGFILETVKNAIFEILNDDITPTFKSIYTDRTRKRDYRLIVEKDNTAMDVNLLSSGEKSLLMLVGDLARRLALANPEAKNPLKEGQGIVLIDEIDLHLHPRWQQKVMGKLQEIFPKIQWVVSTHSPLVISGYDILPEQVLILTQEENSNKKLAISLADLHAHNSGVEPNRILEEIMRIHLRDKRAEDKIATLSQLLNPVDFEKPATRQLMEELTHRFGTDDPFIKRAEHTLKILYRKKASN